MKKAESTKYHQASLYIKEYILKNNLSHGEKLPTENELSRMLSASRITVRRAISELQAEGLVTCVQGSGIFVNTGSPEGKRVRYVPLILPGDAQNSELFEMVLGVEKYLSANACFPTMHFSHRDPNQERAIIQRLVTEADAKHILIFPCRASENHAFFRKMQKRGVKFIFLDRMPDRMVGSLVTCDNLTGGYLATEHLVQRGCRRIAYLCLTDIGEAQSVVQRLDGYRLALEDYGVPSDENMISFHEPGSTLMSRLERLLALSEPPDGIFCANDLCAMDAMKGLEKLGVRVPQDVAVIGFDNMPILRTLPYEISTMEQSFFDLGYEAAEIAYRMMDGTLNHDQHKILPIRLVARKSTDRP